MKVQEIIKEFCVVSDSTWDALKEKTIPELGAVYRVHNLESKRCQAFPTMHYVTVTLTEVRNETPSIFEILYLRAVKHAEKYMTTDEQLADFRKLIADDEAA